MACLVDRKNGKIVSVKTENGEESKLFSAIHSIPFLAGTDTSLDIYKNAYSEKVQKEFGGQDKNKYSTGEPKLFIKGSRGVYDSIEDAVIANEDTGLVAGFKSPINDDFMPICKFNTHGNPRGEFIFSQIAKGQLSAERVIDENGDTFFNGKGVHIIDRKMGAKASKFDAYMDGNARVKVFEDGRVLIPNTEMVSMVTYQDGSTKYVRNEDLLEEIKKNPINKGGLLYTYLATVKEIIPNTSDDFKENKEDLSNILPKLKNFLRIMGFNVTTLESYYERYNKLNGEDPDVQALADMANKIVAFREGKIGLEDLSEEVAHIAIEYFADQNSIAEALSNVVSTDEYNKYSEYYRGKYSSQVSDNVKLEDMVRREVLGKILSNVLNDRFSTGNKTNERVSLIGKLQSIWESFVDFLRNNVRSTQVNELKKINEKLADSILSGKIEDFEADRTIDSVYFSAMSKDTKVVELKLREARIYLDNLYQKVLKTKVNDASLDKITDNMNENSVMSSANRLIGIANQQVKILKNNIELSTKNGVHISRSDLVRYGYIEKILETFRGISKGIESLNLEDKYLKEVQSKITNTIKETRSIFDTLEPVIRDSDTALTNELAKKFIRETDLTDSEQEEYMRQYKTDVDTTSFIGYGMGLMSAMHNKMLNILGRMSFNITSKVNQGFIDEVQPVLRDAEKGRWETFDKSVIQKDENGDNTMYFESPTLEHLRDEDLFNAEVKAIKSVMPDMSIEDIKKELKKSNSLVIINNPELHIKFRDEFDRLQKDIRETFMSESYKEEKRKKFDDAHISSFTRDYLSQKNSSKSKRDDKYKDANGNIDSSKKSAEDKFQDQVDINNYKQQKSPYDGGQIKEGIKVITLSELSKEDRDRLVKKLPYTVDSEYNGDIVVPLNIENENYVVLADKLEPDSRITLDLHTWDMTYRMNKRDKGTGNVFNEDFLKRMGEVGKSGGNMFEWAIANSSLTFTSDYFNELSDNSTTYVEAAENYLNFIPNTSDNKSRRDSLGNSINLLKNKISQKKDILKRYRKVGRPMETDASSMNFNDRKSVVGIEEEIEGLKRSIRVPSRVFSNNNKKLSTVELSDDFYNDFTESSYSTVYDFATRPEVMTSKNRIDCEDFSISVTHYTKKYTNIIKKSYAEFIDKINSEGKLEGKTPDEVIQILKDEFVKDKVADYYKKFVPIDSTSFLNELKSRNDFEEIKKLLNRDSSYIDNNPASKYIEVTPEHSWANDIMGEDSRNKNYRPNEFFLQSKLRNKDGSPSKYINIKWFEKYGINLQEWLKNPTYDLSKMTPTKNIDEYNYIKSITELNEASYEDYNKKGTISKFKRPQLSRTKMEELKTVLTPSNLKNVKGSLSDSWKDMFMNRSDEKIYGEVSDSNDLNDGASTFSVKEIPTYFINDLESPAVVTENTMQSVMLLRKQSMLYKARSEAEADFNAMLRRINAQTSTTSKIGGIFRKGQKGFAAMKAEEFVNSQLYGIKQNMRMSFTVGGKNIDVTKVVHTIQGFVRFTNLAYNYIIDLTGLATSQTVTWSDRFAGDYYHKSSFDRGLKKSTKAFEYLLENGKLYKNSELNHLFEMFMVQTQIDERLQNSAQGRALRLLNNSPYGMTKIADMGMKPQAMYAVLMDTRFIDGKFQSWNQYFNSKRAIDKTADMKALETNFKSASTKSLYDYLDITKDGIKPNEEFKKLFPNDYKEQFSSMVTKLSAKMDNLVQTIDAVIHDSDRTAAQRNVIANTFMMHKGWLPIQVTKRFKRQHVNLMTGKIEQGHYLVLGSIIKDIVKSRSLKNVSRIISELPIHQRANLKRIGFNMATLLSIILMGRFIFSHDDDDDSYMEDLMQLVFLRMSSQFNEDNITGMGISVVEAVKSPITIINTVEALEPFHLIKGVGNALLLDFDPIVKDLKKVTPYKKIGQLQDLQKGIDNFWFSHKSIPFEHPIKGPLRRERAEKKKERARILEDM